MSSQHRQIRLAPTALIITAALGIGSLIPVLRDALVAARLGASGASDAYFLSTYIMLMVVMILVADSTTQAAVVTLSTPEQERSDGWRLHRVVLGATLGLAMIATLVALLAEPLVGLLAPGFDQETVSQAVDATRAVAPGIVFLGLAWLVNAYLNAAGYFVLPALLTPIVALGACVPLLLGTRSPAIAAAGWTLGAGLGLLILSTWALLVATTGRQRQPVAAWLNPDRLRKLLALATPLLLLVIVTQSAEIADRVISSHINTGALTSISLAKKTMILPNTILVAAIGTVTLPFLTRESTGGSRSGAFIHTVNLALFFLIPIAAFLALARSDLVRVLYGRGEFSLQDVSRTADLLGLYALALIPVTMGVILQRSFATLGESRAPLVPYTLAIGGYIVGAWFGAEAFGLSALPVAFAAAEFGYVASLLVMLHRRLQFHLPALVWPACIAGLAALGSGIGIAAIDALDPGNAWLSLGAKALLAGAAYIALVVWFRHPIATEILQTLRGIGVEDGPRPTRVAIEVTYAKGRDGTGRYLSSLVRELKQRQDVEVLPFRAPRVERLPRLIRVPINGGLHAFWLQVVLPLWAWQRDIDVIHANMTGPIVAPVPVVVTVHDGLDYHPEWRPSRIWSTYVQTAGAIAARRAAAVVTVSNAAAAEVATYFRIAPDRLHIVWNGSEMTKIEAEPPPGSRELKRPFVLTMGAHNRRKNLDTALAAVETLRERGHDITLVLVGPNVSHLSRGREWVHTYTNCTDAEIAWLYRQAVAVCVPSQHEGFGLPVLEAVTFGVPVVASDIPSLREVGLGAARFASPDDHLAFAAQLETIVARQDQERERIQPITHQAAAYTWRRTADQIVQIYAHVLDPTERSTVWLSTAAP